MTAWMIAGLYDLLSGSGLIAGAVAGLWLHMRRWAIAAVTAVGVSVAVATERSGPALLRLQLREIGPAKANRNPGR